MPLDESTTGTTLEDELVLACAGSLHKRPAPPKYFLHRYYEKNDQLYYVVEADTPADTYLVENCGTEYTMWIDGEYLRKEVNWISKSRKSRSLGG